MPGSRYTGVGVLFFVIFSVMYGSEKVKQDIKSCVNGVVCKPAPPPERKLLLVDPSHIRNVEPPPV